MSIYKMDVLGHSGPIRAVFLPKGVPPPNNPDMAMDKDVGALVEFYDLRYAGFTPDGQFITRYFAKTLLESWSSGATKFRGLNLNCGVPDWSIGPKPYSLILLWLEYLNSLHSL